MFCVSIPCARLHTWGVDFGVASTGVNVPEGNISNFQLIKINDWKIMSAILRMYRSWQFSFSPTATLCNSCTLCFLMQWSTLHHRNMRSRWIINNRYWNCIKSQFNNFTYSCYGFHQFPMHCNPQHSEPDCQSEGTTTELQVTTNLIIFLAPLMMVSLLYL